MQKKSKKKILKGRVEFNSQTKQLMFYPIETNLKLELSSTSSMVSELAPIVSYLRYVLTENAKRTRRRVNSKVRPACNLIMIEEPEAHLHPEIQLLLTEIFSKLVNQNVKLVITSHSNYIFNKVNNLIMSDTLSVNRVSSGVFKSTKTGSVLHQLEVNELGVEDNNFNDATSALFDEKMEIISKLNDKEYACD
ncbi:AAA family ATPase [Vibrio parahaemolyticus]|nr:AAA family ATPase [Vibrio parahaemolyticus]MBE4263405.1 AAA family ATPase [Vibrio parahaemolyticus]MBE4530792.1 AAA family ATPase [Vibrio parahaemolyticus]